jgi:hypothetical protein
MAALVPEYRLELPQSDGSEKVTAATRSVRAQTWVDATRLQCWLAGRGSMDVPVHAPYVTIAAGATSAFRYWCKPRYQTTRYAYSFVLTAGSRGTASVKIPSTSGTDYDVQITEPRNATPVTIYVDRTSQSSAEAELSFDITAPASLGLLVESVSIEAVPRTRLTAADDLGADRFLFLARSPIYVGSFANELLARQNDLRNACRRNGFMFSRGTNDPWDFTGAAAQLFDDYISVTGRYLYNGDTTRTLRCRILAMCSDGTTAGKFNLSNTGGAANLDITIAAGTTSWTWLPATSSDGTFAVNAEDNTAADGFRTAADQHTFTGERTAGAGTVSIASVCLFDAAD